MNLFLTMVAAMWRILRDIATSKTQRYFLSSVERDMSDADDDGDQYPMLIGDVVRTFCMVMSKRAKSSRVEADGENYPVSDYQFPTAWWKLSLARRVYMTRGAIEFAKPYFEFEAIPGRIMSPAQVMRFFEAYNSTQTDQTKIVLAGVPDNFNDSAYLNQFKALCSGDLMSDWNEAGEIEDIVAQILGITCPVDSQYLKTWERYEERSVDKWLMSVM